MAMTQLNQQLGIRLLEYLKAFKLLQLNGQVRYLDVGCLAADSDYLGAYLMQLLESSRTAEGNLWVSVGGTRYLKVCFENVFIRELSVL